MGASSRAYRAMAKPSPLRIICTALVVLPPKSIETNWSRFLAAPFKNGSPMLAFYLFVPESTAIAAQNAPVTLEKATHGPDGLDSSFGPSAPSKKGGLERAE